MHIGCIVALLGICAACPALSQSLPLPPRSPDAPSGTELARQLELLELERREQEIFTHISRGNIPEFLRAFETIHITNQIAGMSHVLRLKVARDYLAIGCDTNFLRVPLTPMTAQRIADSVDCSLPTPKLVDDLWANASLKLIPQPLAPGPTMITVPVFVQHQELVEGQIAARSHQQLVAGHKKDIVLAAVLAKKPESVAIYGWHRSDGKPIQPVYAGHASTWADYSHGTRLVANDAELDGKPVRLPELLTDPRLAAMVSNEGPLPITRYPTNCTTPDSGNRSNSSAPSKNFTPGDLLMLNFKRTGDFDEAQAEFRFDSDVRVVINRPAVAKVTNTLLVVYTLPNGNTIEQTAGRRLHTNDDWHFNIQHIAAQTRFVRQRLTNQSVIVAYLEAGGLTWPAWRKKHGDDAIPKMVASLQSACSGTETRTVLASHSGGGSFVFGYLNSVTNVPASIERIAFLDSNYGYTAAHKEKLLNWLRASAEHRLIVLAYNDAAGLLNGKPFVSASGGTWGRSATMLEQLGSELNFSATTNGNLHAHLALDGRVEFLLRENPERKIWHTVQVERNGFIHALLSGTPFSGKDYQYLGERAYDTFIADK